jgi:TolA-binding protein
LRGQTLLSQRNYDGALSEFQKVLSLPLDKPSKDEALFNIGLVYAHFGNPQRDVEKSLEFFKRLINHYPKSSLAEQAKMWVGILEENEKLNQVIRRMKQADIEIEEMRRKRTQ